MIKRIPALFFVLFASIVLLANAAIPHHHHETEVCIESTHCDSENDHHHDGAAEHNHEHDCETSPGTCVLKQIFVMPSAIEKHELKSIDLLDHFIDFNGTQAILPGAESKSKIALHYSDAPPILPASSFYLHYSIRSLGFRAPPLV